MTSRAATDRDGGGASFYRRDQLPYGAAFLAGKELARVLAAQGRRVTRLPDFYIGAHGAIAGHQLLTQDARLYRTYFPRLVLIAP